jgi:hypothetical protein
VSAWESAGKSDDWYTPKYIFDALGCRFDLDVAAPFAGPRHVPCEQWLCADVMGGGLVVEWRGYVWCNPPFGGRNGIEPWLRRFFDHGNGVALTPDRTSAPWFRRWAPKATSLLFLPKVKFERPDGTIGKSPSTGTALWAAGARAHMALRNAQHLGVWVLPQASPARRIDQLSEAA